jgi:hypothetical protein
VTQRADDGHLVLDTAAVTVGDQLTTRLAHGCLVSRVEEVFAETDERRFPFGKETA